MFCNNRCVPCEAWPDDDDDDDGADEEQKRTEINRARILDYWHISRTSFAQCKIEERKLEHWRSIVLFSSDNFPVN